MTRTKAFLRAAEVIRRNSRFWDRFKIPRRAVLRNRAEHSEVKSAANFVWGGNDEMPLHEDMMFWQGTEAYERAARVAESLAYDNTDGPP